LEKTALQIVKKLKDAGFETYFAGGCVRDIILKHEPQDYDIVTSAKPDEIEHILEHTIPIGKKFGVILSIKNHHQFEIATFRSDSTTSDGRRPAYITYTTARNDAMRRDFTINGMFYDPLTQNFLDYVGGKNDLHENIIRFIGDPEKRITEDHLRIMRAIRFRNKLQFQYHPKTYQALRKLGHLARKNSSERIRDELNKIIKLKNVNQAFTDLEDLGILHHILPEILNLKGVAQPLRYHQEGDVWDHTFKALHSVSTKAPLEVRWAVLLHDVGKPDTFKLKADRIHFDGHCSKSEEIAIKILKRLNFSRQFITNVAWIIKHHMMMIPLTKMTNRRKLHWYHHPQFNNLLRLCRADIMGTNPHDLRLYQKIRNDYLRMKKLKKNKPLLMGKDILRHFKISSGPMVGEILKHIEHLYLEEKIHNKKEALIIAKKWLKKAPTPSVNKPNSVKA